MRLIASIFLCMLLMTQAAAGQRLRGRVVDQGTEQPIAAAMIVLVDAAGVERGSVMSSAAGTFSIAVPGEGLYTVRVRRIGFAEWTSSPLAVDAGTPSQEFAVPVRAIQLAGLVAEAHSECRARPEEGLATGVLWTEARKALQAAAWADSTEQWRFRSRVYQRDRNRQGEVEAEQDSTFWTTSTSPFRARPAWLLAEDGFVVRQGVTTRFFAPDASVLLSDEFLGVHCYRAIRGQGEHAGMVGLEFEPIEDRDDPDVRGVLWLDPTSSELKYVTYTYVNIPRELVADELGGRVDFERIEGGGWLVRRWSITMPRTRLEQAGTQRNRTVMARLLGYREAGGEIVAIASGAIRPTRPARVMGVVFDSTQGRPLAGATVYVDGTQHSAVTEGTGRYLINAPIDGEFTVRVVTPRADSLGYAIPARPISVRPGQIRSVNFAIPSWSGIVQRVCGGDRPDATLIVGVVRGPGGVPLAGARVRAVWAETPAAGGFPRMGRATAVSGANGVYGFCEIADSTATDLVALYGLDRSEVVSLRREGREVRRRGTALRPDGPVRTVNLTIAEAPWASIAGAVTSRDGASPIAGASVEVPVLGLRAESAADGRFELVDLPPGDHRLIVRHPAYQMTTSRVTLQAAEHTELAAEELAMDPAATMLPELVAEAEVGERRRLDAVGFGVRRSRDIGEFITREEFMVYEPLLVKDVLRRIPGVRIGVRMERNVPPGSTPAQALTQREPIEQASVDNRAQTIQLRGGCEPVVYLDGAPLNPGIGVDIDALVAIGDVLAIEVYSSSAGVPPEFTVLNSGCGVVIIWTR